MTPFIIFFVCFALFFAGGTYALYKAAPLISKLTDWAAHYFKQLPFEEVKAHDLAKKQRLEEEARRKYGGASFRSIPQGLFLGNHIGGAGEKPFPPDSGIYVGQQVLMDFFVLGGHIAVFGTTQHGKTEFLKRLISETLEKTDWDVFLLDGKGNIQFGDAFCGLAYRWNRGNPPRLFIGKNRVGYPFNGLVGSKDRIRNLLIELANIAQLEGNAIYHGKRQRIAISAIVDAPQGPPRDFSDLLSRLTATWLYATYGKGTPFEKDAEWKSRLKILTTGTSKDAAPIDELATQFLATIDELGHVVKADGFTLGDVRAASFCIDLANVPFVGRSFTEFVLSSFLGYTSYMSRPALLVIDEFGVLNSPNLAHLLATASQAGLKIVFTVQAHAQLGDRLAQERILSNCNTQVFFKLNFPEYASDISGTVMQPETSYQSENGIHTGITSTRFQHQYAIDPNVVRSLPKGHCFIYHDGANCHIQVERLTSIPQAPAEELYVPGASYRPAVQSAAYHPKP